MHRHIKRQHSEPEFKCSTCGKQFGINSDLLRHIRCSHGTGNFCESCGAVYKSPSGLLQHKIKYHNEDPRFMCQVEDCNYRTNRKQEFLDHINCHDKIKNHECPYCGKKIATRTGLITHKKRCKKGCMPECYTCGVCNRKFKAKIDLQQHYQKHDTKTYTCIRCGKTFKWKNIYFSHRKRCLVDLN